MWARPAGGRHKGRGGAGRGRPRREGAARSSGPGADAEVCKPESLQQPPKGWGAGSADHASRGAPRPLPGPVMPCGAPDVGGAWAMLRALRVLGGGPPCGPPAPLVLPVRGRKTRHDPPAKSKVGRVATPPKVDPVELFLLTERYRQYRQTVCALRCV